VDGSCFLSRFSDHEGVFTGFAESHVNVSAGFPCPVIGEPVHSVEFRHSVVPVSADEKQVSGGEGEGFLGKPCEQVRLEESSAVRGRGNDFDVLADVDDGFRGMLLDVRGGCLTTDSLCSFRRYHEGSGVSHLYAEVIRYDEGNGVFTFGEVTYRAHPVVVVGAVHSSVAVQIPFPSNDGSVWVVRFDSFYLVSAAVWEDVRSADFREGRVSENVNEVRDWSWFRWFPVFDEVTRGRARCR